MTKWSLSGEEIKSGVDELMSKTTSLYDQIAALQGDQVTVKVKLNVKVKLDGKVKLNGKVKLDVNYRGSIDCRIESNMKIYSTRQSKALYQMLTVRTMLKDS